MFFVLGMVASFAVGNGYPMLVGGVLDAFIHRKSLKKAYEGIKIIVHKAFHRTK